MRLHTFFKDLLHFVLAFSVAAALVFFAIGAQVPALTALKIAGGTMLLKPLLRLRVHTLTSIVPEFSGACVPVWLNTNYFHRMESGAITGFFRKAVRLPGLPVVIATGPDFHGYIKTNGTVASTEGHYGRLPE